MLRVLMVLSIMPGIKADVRAQQVAHSGTGDFELIFPSMHAVEKVFHVALEQTRALALLDVLDRQVHSSAAHFRGVFDPHDDTVRAYHEGL